MARQLDGEKRKSILEAGRRTFGDQGYQKSTIREIAESAGLAQGTLYTYFENKEVLFVAVVEDIWQEFIPEIRRIVDDDAGVFEKLTRFIDVGLEKLKSLHPLLRGMFSEANRLQLLNKKMDEFCAFLDPLIAGAAEAGLISGVTSDPALRRFNLDIITSGILFRASLATPDELNAELDAIKRGLIASLSERFERGQGQGQRQGQGRGDAQ